MKIAIISDIHEDYENLQKAMKLLAGLELEKIICLGDIVGFEKRHYKYSDTRSAQKCVDLLKENSCEIVAGNHDILAAGRLPFHSEKIGFPNNWYTISMEEKRREYEHKFFIYKDEEENDLTEKGEEFLKNLLPYKLVPIEDYNILVSHFIYPDINGNLNSFYNNKDGFSLHFKWMENIRASIGFIGHTHLDGIGLVRKKGLKINKFGLYSLKAEPTIIMCPAIARGKSKNGFIIFDSVTKTIEAIRI